MGDGFDDDGDGDAVRVGLGVGDSLGDGSAVRDGWCVGVTCRGLSGVDDSSGGRTIVHATSVTTKTAASTSVEIRGRRILSLTPPPSARRC